MRQVQKDHHANNAPSDKPSTGTLHPSSPPRLLQLRSSYTDEGRVKQPSMNDGNQLPTVYQDPVKEFGGHEDGITSIATFPDGERIVTGSLDKTIRIWRIEDGKEMQKWCVKQIVGALVISRDGKHVVSGEGSFDQTEHWELWVRDAETGRIVAGPLHGHTNLVFALDISLDGLTLVSGSWDCTVILWDTTTWQKKGDPLECGAHVTWVQFSPNGQLGVATSIDNQIWDSDRRERSAQFKGHADFKKAWNFSFTWTHDGAYLLSAGGEGVIRSWDISMGVPVGIPWTGHNANEGINHIILDPTGTILASASTDHTVRLWIQRGTEVSRYQHSNQVLRVTFSANGRFIFSGEGNGKLSQWEISEDVLTAARGDPLPGELKTEVTIFHSHSTHQLMGVHRSRAILR